MIGTSAAPHHSGIDAPAGASSSFMRLAGNSETGNNSQAPQSGGATGDPAAEPFNSAKELGTAEAWAAFLASYPNGFYADLARAYLAKLNNGAAPAIAAGESVPATGTAHELPCRDKAKLRSGLARAATKITFVNTSGQSRLIQWINYDGGLKDFGALEPGDRITFATFVTHPWRISTATGDCLQIFMPDVAPSIIELAYLSAGDATTVKTEPRKERYETRPKKREVRDEPASKPKKKPLVCGTNYKLSKGACVLVQNCGANAKRSPEGDCYCNKNYQMKNGTCVWKTDKQGFEVAPWKKSGCTTWQAQCSKGNGKACGQYEANCQVN